MNRSSLSRPALTLSATLVAVFVALAAWAFASPVGASPDDDFHLASIYCENENSTLCAFSETPNSKLVSSALLTANCFATQEDVSAECQQSAHVFDNTHMVDTTRGNFVGQYPGIFYSVLSVFAGDDIQTSVLLMRLFNSALFVLLLGLLFIASSTQTRVRIGLLWAATMIPLGLFIVPSTNPSSWAIMGVGAAFLALFSMYNAQGWRKYVLASTYVLGVVIAAGARADAAVIIVIASVATIALQKPFRSVLSWWSALPLAGILFSAVVYLRASQTNVLSTGISTSGEAPTHGAVEIFFGNILNIPSLWLGVFGSWGLGWLDTQMPAIVWCGASSVFVAVMFVALKKATRREYLVAGALFLALAAIPLYVLQKSMVPVGAEVQPRYILPLLILFAAVVLTSFSAGAIDFSKTQLIVVGVLLSAAQSIALYINLRRYVSGGHGGPILDLGSQWWWNLPFGPMWIWGIGTVTFTFCIVVLVRQYASVTLKSPATIS